MSSMLNFRDARSLWWSETDDVNAARAMIETFTFLDNDQAHHRDRNLHHLRLYSNRMAAALSGAAFAEFYPWDDERLRVNIVQAVIDAAVSQIATNRPRAMPLTIDGEWELEQRAKLMGRFIDGLFYGVDQYELGLQIFQDAATYGTGIEQIYNSFGEVGAERVHPDEFVVDDIEARGGRVRTTYRYKESSIEVAKAVFNPEGDTEKDRIIEKAKLLREDHFGRQRIYQPISLIESFHAPSAPGAKDGKHIVATSEGPLLVERWDRRLPYAYFRWKWPGIGFWGTGIAEEVAPIQIEVNYILEKIQRLLWTASPSTWVQKGSVTDEAWTNEEFAIREYNGGQPPVFNNPAAVNPEYFTQVQTLIDRAFQLTGISQLYASSQKPSGLNSGEAIKNYNDIQSSRFLHVGQRYEQFHMTAAELMFEEARALKDAGYTVVGKGAEGLEQLRFGDIDIERDKYQMRVFPTAFMPTTPAGKMDTIEQFGKIMPEMQKYLLAELQFPDLEKAVSVINAPLTLTDMMIDRILTHGKSVTVEPMWPHELMRDRAVLMAARAQTKNAPEERVDSLRKLADDCQAMIDEKAAAAQAAAQPAMPQQQPMTPQGGAMPPEATPAGPSAPLPLQ